MRVAFCDGLTRQASREDFVFLTGDLGYAALEPLREAPTSSYAFSYDEVRRAPGAIGDVSRLMQALPGMVVSNDQRNDLIARGGSPIESVTIVDHIEVPNLSHFGAQAGSGGPVTMLNNELLRDATLHTGALPSRMGNRLSAALDLRLRDGSRDRHSVELDVSAAGAGAVLEGPLGTTRDTARARGSYIVAARRSYLELLAAPLGVSAIPEYWNMQGKVSVDLSTRDQLSAVVLAGLDYVRFGVDETDTSEPLLDEIDQRGWRAVSGATWRRQLRDGAMRMTASDVRSLYRVDVSNVWFGPELVFRNRSLESEQSLAWDLTRDVAHVGTVSVGALLRRMGGDVDLTIPFGAQNPLANAPGRVDTVAAVDRVTATVHGVHAQLSRDVVVAGRRLSLTGGARIDHFGLTRAALVSPRLGGVFALHSAWSWSFSAARYHQSVPLVFTVAAPENRALAPMRADHLVTGVAWMPTPEWRVGVELYRKAYREYPVSTRYPTLSIANGGDAFGVNGSLLAFNSAGTGLAHGIELSARRTFSGNWYGHANVTWSRVQHAALDGISRPGAFDAPRAATVLGGWRAGDGWEFSTRISYADGRPITPADAMRSRMQNRLVLDLTRVADERTPAYARWDVRVDRRSVVRGRTVAAYLELQNMLNRNNVWQYVWNQKVNRLQAVRQTAFLPVLGLNIEW